MMPGRTILRISRLNRAMSPLKAVGLQFMRRIAILSLPIITTTILIVSTKISHQMKIIMDLQRSAIRATIFRAVSMCAFLIQIQDSPARFQRLSTGLDSKMAQIPTG